MVNLMIDAEKEISKNYFNKKISVNIIASLFDYKQSGKIDEGYVFLVNFDLCK